MKFLPGNLQRFELILSYNNLGGKNTENFRWLEQGMRQLPDNLEHLRLNLQGNKLGENVENMKYLGKGME